MELNKNTTYLPSGNVEVSYSTTPVPFTPPNQIYIMRVVSDQNCKIGWLNSGFIYLVSGIPEYFPVNPGDPLTVTSDGTDGTLHVGWMTN